MFSPGNIQKDKEKISEVTVKPQKFVKMMLEGMKKCLGREGNSEGKLIYC